MIYLIVGIYLLGVILVWIAHKLSCGSKQTWEDIGERFIYSIFSWVTILVLIIQLIFSFFPKNPPKWL